MTSQTAALIARLTRAQNALACNGGQIDIMTIAGFMDATQLLAHVERYEAQTARAALAQAGG